MDVGAVTAIFIGPVFGLAVYDFTRFPNNAMTTYDVDTTTLVYYGVWCLTLLVLYACYFRFAREKCIEWVEIMYHRYLNDVARLLYDASFLFVSGGVRSKIDRRPELYVGCLIGYAVIYASIFEAFKKRKIVIVWNRHRRQIGQRDLGVECDPDTLQKHPELDESTNVDAIIVGVVGFLGLVFLSIDLLMTAWTVSPSFFAVYTTIFFVVVGVHAFMMMYAQHYHVHHWALALLGAHACVFDSMTSTTAQAMFVAVYVHGMACFGAENVFL